MKSEEHYADDALIALLGSGGAARSAAAQHLDSCAACNGRLAEYAMLIEALRDPVVWESKPLDGSTAASNLFVLRSAAERIRQENAQAAMLVAELLDAPRQEWRRRAAGDDRYRTAGTVRKLVTTTYPTADRVPAAAVEMARTALQIATAIGDRRLCGDAAHALAYALLIVGDLRGAMDALASAEEAFASLPVSDFEVARLRITRSMVLAAMDKFGDALGEVRASTNAFSAFGDERRLLTVRCGEAVVRFRAGDFRGALQTWLAVEPRLDVNDPERPNVLQNIAACYNQLHQANEALEWHRRACDALAAAGATANLLRARWTLARMLVWQQRWEDAAVVLRAVLYEFAQADMREELVLTRLDLAEVFLASGKEEEASALCHGIVEELRDSQLEQTQRAHLAVSYLHEAVRSRKATPRLVTHVREYVERVRTEPALLFAPPPE